MHHIMFFRGGLWRSLGLHADSPYQSGIQNMFKKAYGPNNVVVVEFRRDMDLIDMREVHDLMETDVRNANLLQDAETAKLPSGTTNEGRVSAHGIKQARQRLVLA